MVESVQNRDTVLVKTNRVIGIPSLYDTFDDLSDLERSFQQLDTTANISKIHHVSLIIGLLITTITSEITSTVLVEQKYISRSFVLNLT